MFSRRVEIVWLNLIVRSQKCSETDTTLKPEYIDLAELEDMKSRAKLWIAVGEPFHSFSRQIK